MFALLLQTELKWSVYQDFLLEITNHNVMILIIYQNSFFCLSYVLNLYFTETNGFTYVIFYFFTSYSFHNIGRL